MYNKNLQDIGLTPHQAAIYEYLVTQGISTASRIARQTGVGRSLTYIVLGELMALKLVERDATKKVARFLITNPHHIMSFLENRNLEIEQAKKAFAAIEHQLQQRYNIQSGQPGVRFYPGIAGLKHVYTDINSCTEKELWVIRSRIKPSEDMLTMISAQVKKQIELGFKVHVIHSTQDVDMAKYHKSDQIHMTERRILAGELFKNPAQMLIYENKVAITTYQEPMMTILVEHADIATTLLSMYQFIWKQSLAETNMFLKKMKKT